jgi:hypothetical protein
MCQVEYNALIGELITGTQRRYQRRDFWRAQTCRIGRPCAASRSSQYSRRLEGPMKYLPLPHLQEEPLHPCWHRHATPQPRTRIWHGSGYRCTTLRPLEDATVQIARTQA